MAQGRFEIRAGAEVIGPGGPIGRVDAVVMNPGTGEVISLVVRKGRFFPRDVVIPIEAVDEATDELVRIRLGVEELATLGTYHAEEFAEPPGDWRSPGGQRAGILFRLPSLFDRRALRPVRSGQTEAAAGGRPIRAGQQVICRDGEVGPLDLVLLDPATRRATHFVVRRGKLLDRDTIVPVAWASEITHDRIVLDVGREQLGRLPEYRPDDEITADVLDLLWYRSELDPEDLHYVEVRTTDGIVELSGTTRSEQARAAIEARARSVRGALGVRSRLASFEALADAAAPWTHIREGPAPSQHRVG